MASVLHRTTKEYLSSVNTPNYPESDWIINPDLTTVAGISPEYWKIAGNVVTEMSQTEKNTVDTASIVLEKAAKITAFGQQIINVLDTHYNTAVRDGFASLKVDALLSIPPKTNRSNYIQQVIDWCFTLQIVFETHKATIMAMTTRAAVAAATIDLTATEASDPSNTLAGAMAITN